MSLSALPLAHFHVETGGFIARIFTKAFEGDLLSLVVLAIVALIIIKFVAARWVFTLAKQTMIFGGLAFAVGYGAFGDGGIGDRFGDTAGQVFLVVGGTIVAGLFFVMLYIFFLRRRREKALIAEGMDPEQARKTVAAKKSGRGASMRMGAGSLSGQGLPVHYEKAGRPKATGAAASGGGGGAVPMGGATAATPADMEASRMEETLKKMNVLGATKEQNLLTVSVLILVAQFGVFTSRTVAAPNAGVGMALFGIFVVAAAVFVMTAYENRMKGIVHFVYATIFALVASVVLLVYWQGNSWAVAVDPGFFFASDALIAAITGVAFSTLLTKGGG